MLVDNSQALHQMVQSISNSEIISIDTETNITDSYAERFCVGISVECDGDEKFYIPVGHTEWVEKPNNFPLSELPKNLFSDFRGVIVMHNAKFDLSVLERIGIEVPTDNLFDTMLMSHYIDELPKGYEKKKPHSLDTLGERFLGFTKDSNLAKLMRQGDWSGTPIYVMAKYAEQDVKVTTGLYKHFLTEFQALYEKTWNLVDRAFMLQLKEIERKGLPISEDLCREYSKACRVREDQIKQELGFDPAKRKLLNSILFSEPPLGLGLTPSEFTPSTNEPKVSAEWLAAQAHPVCALVLEYRRLGKQRSTYFDRFVELSAGRMRIHPTFNQHGTVTGRLSCSDPNLQQIPRQSFTGHPVKKVFRAEPGYELWESDYSQLELRLAAVYAKQQNMIDDFNNDIDIHQRVADLLGITRQIAKIVNFLLIYGGGAEALSLQAGISLKAARDIFNSYRKAYPAIFQLMKEAEQNALRVGHVQLWNGRRRHFHYNSECRKAFNSLIQGGGFEIVKRSMLMCREAGVDIRNQVHDSIWYMVKEGESEKYVPMVEEVMSKWTKPSFGLHFKVESKQLA